MILVFGSINIDVLVPVPALPQPGETVLGGDYALLIGAAVLFAVIGAVLVMLLRRGEHES